MTRGKSGQLGTHAQYRRDWFALMAKVYGLETRAQEELGSESGRSFVSV